MYDKNIVGSIYKPHPVENPFLSYIGAQYVYANTNGCELHLSIDKHLSNTFGGAHGGLLTTLMDTAMSWSAQFYDDVVRTCLTLEIKSSFFSRVLIGDKVCCRAKVLHKTSTLMFCEAEIYILNSKKNNLNKEQTQPACKSSATFKIFKVLK